MGISVDIDLGYEFQVKAAFKEVFDLLSDVPAAAAFFPRVSRLTNLGGGVYRWEMDKLGTAQVSIHAVYTSKYVASRARGTVVWTPVKTEGNSQVGGSWKIADRKRSTALEFKVNCSVEVPLPSLMKMVVAPVVKSEFERLVETYIDNLIVRFGGAA